MKTKIRYIPANEVHWGQYEITQGNKHVLFSADEFSDLLKAFTADATRKFFFFQNYAVQLAGGCYNVTKYTGTAEENLLTFSCGQVSLVLEKFKNLL